MPHSPGLVDEEKVLSRSRGSKKDRHPEVHLSQTLHQEYSRNPHRKKWEANAIDDDKFRAGAQWTKEELKDLEKQKRQPAVANVIAPAVELAISMMTARNPTYSASPSEDADVGMSKVAKMLLEHGWYRSNGNSHLAVALGDFESRGGRAVMYQYYDPNADFGKGEVMVGQLDTLKVFCDPNSKDPLWRDAQHVLYVDRVSFHQMVTQYPQMEGKIRAARPSLSTSMGASDTEFHGDRSAALAHEDSEDFHHTRYDVITRWSKVTLTYNRVLDVSSGAEDILSEEEFERWLDEEPGLVVLEEGGQAVVGFGPRHAAALKQYRELGGTGQDEVMFHVRETASVSEDGEVVTGQMIVEGPEDADGVPGSTVIIQPVTRREMIDGGAILRDSYPQQRCRMVVTIGDDLLFTALLPVSRIPVVPAMNHFNRNPWPSSSIDQVRELQREVNYRKSKINAWLANTGGQIDYVPIGSIVDKDEHERALSTPGRHAVEVNTEFGNVTTSTPVQLPGELFLDQDRTIQMIERIIGVFTLQQGDSSQAPNTYRGLLALDEFGNRRIGYKLKSVYAMLAELGRVAFEMFQAYYTAPRIFRIVQPQTGSVSELAINQPIYDDFSRQIGVVNDLSVGVYDIRIVPGSLLPTNRAAEWEQHLQALQAGIIDQEEALKKSEIYDIEGILERQSIISQLQSYVAQLEDMVKNLQGDLQTADREAVAANKREVVGKEARRLQMIVDKAQNDQQLAKARLGDIVRTTGKEMSLKARERSLTNGEA